MTTESHGDPKRDDPGASDPHSDAPEQVERPADDDPDGESEAALLKRERDKYLDLAKRTQAEFENYQKRAAREREADRRFAAWPVVLDLLPVLDNLERALESAKGNDATSALREGIEIVHKQWLDALAKHGVAPIAPLGEPFDPNQHEAILQQPSDEHPPMTVVGVARTGYRLHERILRPAQVIVSASAEQVQ